MDGCGTCDTVLAAKHYIPVCQQGMRTRPRAQTQVSMEGLKWHSGDRHTSWSKPGSSGPMMLPHLQQSVHQSGKRCWIYRFHRFRLYHSKRSSTFSVADRAAGDIQEWWDRLHFSFHLRFHFHFRSRFRTHSRNSAHL